MSLLYNEDGVSILDMAVILSSKTMKLEMMHASMWLF